MIFYDLSEAENTEKCVFWFGFFFAFLPTRSRKQLFRSFRSHRLWIRSLGQVTVLGTGLAAQVLDRPAPPFSPFPVTPVPISGSSPHQAPLVGRSRPGGLGRPSREPAPPSCPGTPSCQAFCQLIPGLLSAARSAACE